MKKNKNIIIWLIVIVAIIAGIVYYSLSLKEKNNKEDNSSTENEVSQISSELIDKEDSTSTTNNSVIESKNNSEISKEIKETSSPTSDTKKESNTKYRDFGIEVKLQDKDGKDILLSEFKGKITVVNFWATWCRFCIDEMPEFYKLYKKYENNPNIKFIFADLLDGSEETKEKVDKFLKTNKIEDLPIFYDVNEENFYNLGLTGVPDTFILNTDGKLVPIEKISDEEYSYLIPGKADVNKLENIIEKELKNIQN